MKKQVLLLNQDNTPLNIITIGKAFKLISKDKVWVDDSSNECYEVVSVSKIVKIPKILILKYYVKLPYKKVAANRKNIFSREGGGSSWTNMVAACKQCNLFKGNRTPKEAKMSLKTKPKEPSYGFLFDSMLISFRKDKNA